MNVISKSPKILGFAALLAGTASAGLAQTPAREGAQEGPAADMSTTVYSAPAAAEMTEGPEVKGIISARTGDKVQVTAADGSKTVVSVDEATRISASSGLFGINKNRLTMQSLLNGLPVTVRTAQSADELVARRITLQGRDLKTASMIRNGTEQGFAEQSAATEALRGRVADIGQYNVKSTTNVNFDTGKAALTPQAKADLCAAASQAEATDNALILVVGYTDSTGSEELNQRLSEKRAGGVVNYLQQQCGWKPYRMLSPTGMAEADPAADNESDEGKAQNRRVAVNVLVSKGLDGI